MTTSTSSKPSSGTAGKAALAYPLGFVSGILCLATSRGEPFVRFHAWQSILLSAALLLAVAALELVPLLGLGLVFFLGVAAVGTTVFLMWRAWRGAWTMLPLLGDIARERVEPRRRH